MRHQTPNELVEFGSRSANGTTFITLSAILDEWGDFLFSIIVTSVKL